ncbi:MAG: type II/IV secretion system protein [Candidatus Omnitrophica bacterium]|nr:type II/IV secretion system protein [Candidatus Omnitrophota bacterium]
MNKNKLGEILINHQEITAQELSLCLDIQSIGQNEKLGVILRHFNFVTDDEIGAVVAEQVGWKFFKGAYVPDREILNILDLSLLVKHQVFPLKTQNGGKTFVVAHIDDLEITDVIGDHFPFINIEFMVGIEKDVRFALENLMQEELSTKVKEHSRQINEKKHVEGVSGFLDELINLAVIQHCTDVHFEPSEKALEISFRVDGMKSSFCCLRKYFIYTIVNRILTLCELNTGEYFKIKDGGFKFKYFDRAVDIRVSIIPSVFGPSIVLRILDRAKVSYDLKSLGYSSHNWQKIQSLIKRPYGIVLVTGPTGSGKSTTLYSLLNHLKSPEKKIVTVENPVEMPQSLMMQTQVNQAQNLTFASAVRAFLRHDPDVILVGEVRDTETAQEAFRAAETGHQVFSTLHTNDVVGSVLRLKDLGVDVVNISNSLVGVVAQRLIRKLCPLCKTKIIFNRDACDAAQTKYLNAKITEAFTAVGCSKCINGYNGRTVVAEVLTVDDEIRDLMETKDLHAMRQLLKNRSDHKDIFIDAKELFLRGETSLDEIVRVLG